MIVKFLGAAQEVTGSKHLVITQKNKKILLDCGMYQGKGKETDAMNRDLGFEPSEIDHIILTHAHIDHSGLIPYVYRRGFRGSVICTHATLDLCKIMLADSGAIHEADTILFNKKMLARGLPPVEPIYTRKDAVKCMELFIGVAYERKFYIDPETKVRFTNTGHMLGSGTVMLEILETDGLKKLAYTGDIGRKHNKILRPPVPFPQCDFLITESTYGDRLHKDHKEARNELLHVIKHTCIEKKGKLVIPSFSVGRTQEIVYTLNQLFNEGKLPRVDIYVDSPLAVNATDVFRLHPECFNDEMLDEIYSDPDPFGFNRLFYTRTVAESKRINERKEPCVIISASGMMEAGRVKHHLANTIANPRNSVLAVGYCAPRTLGAKILRGDKEISIHGNVYPVNAEIFRIDSYSGHGDYEEMIDFLNCQDKEQIKRTFIVHGEKDAQETYKQHLEDDGFGNIEIPERGYWVSL
ncbi:MBL fold metallo-hydrolase RNA specificity domain-containing protein [Saccharicrinis sp. FJH2]|uniref:MBL fold metallo-hydrolase RNA specificity domain-containing protein n=1 Tax=Saccharicrinis sp. FJH65 TaxID=3344659 RepID=UPI0035F406BE